MKRFSQRIGAYESPSIIQLDTMSDALRNSIWNFMVSMFNDGDSGWWQIAEFSARFFFKLPVDDLPDYNFRRRDWIKIFSTKCSGTRYTTLPNSLPTTMSGLGEA